MFAKKCHKAKCTDIFFSKKVSSFLEWKVEKHAYNDLIHPENPYKNHLLVCYPKNEKCHCILCVNAENSLV